MSTTKTILNSLEKQLPKEFFFENDNIMNDIRYKRELSMLIINSLQKGSDVMQMESGDIIVTELKPITLEFHWDNKKGKFERTKSSTRAKRIKINDDDYTADEDFITNKKIILEEA